MHTSLTSFFDDDFEPDDMTPEQCQAAFDYENMTAAEAWSYVWYLRGEEIDSGDGQAMGSSAGYRHNMARKKLLVYLSQFE